MGLDVANPGQRKLLERGPGSDEILHELVGWRGQNSLRAIVLGNAGALLEDQDAVAELDGLVDVVGHAHDGLLELRLDIEQLILEPLAGDWIDGAEGLVHEDHGRIGRQPAGHADALLLSAGQLARVPVPVALGLQAHEVEEFVDAFGRALLVPLEQTRHQRDVVGHGHVREETAALDDVTDRAPELIGILGTDIFTVDRDGARSGIDESVDHLERGGLAAA